MEILPVFIYSSPVSIFYHHCFTLKLHQAYCLSVSFSSFIVICFVLSFRAYASVSSFCLTLYLFVLDSQLQFLALKAVTLCRSGLVVPYSAVHSFHQNQVLHGCPFCGLHVPSCYGWAGIAFRTADWSHPLCLLWPHRTGLVACAIRDPTVAGMASSVGGASSHPSCLQLGSLAQLQALHKTGLYPCSTTTGMLVWGVISPLPQGRSHFGVDLMIYFIICGSISNKDISFSSISLIMLSICRYPKKFTWKAR